MKKHFKKITSISLKKNSTAIIIIAGCVLIGTILILGGHAATPAVNVEAESGSVSSAASTIADASASGGHAVKFGSGSTSTPGCTPTTPDLVGFANNCNTGYKSAPDYPGSLTTYSATANGTGCSGPIVSNKTYNFCSFPGGISVGTRSALVSNVTFNGCWFQTTAGNIGGALVLLYGDNLTFSYDTFTPINSAPPTAYAQAYEYGLEADGGYYTSVQQLTVTNSEFWGYFDAIDTNGSTQAKPQVFRDNYLHDTAADGGVAHVDGIGTLSGTGVSSYDVIDHNTIESVANTNAIAFQGGTYDHLSITNNLLGGFGYTVNISGTRSNITFTGNTFSTELQMAYGPTYPNSFWTTTGSVWSGNKWLVPAGANWGNPAHSGWFWLPSNSENGGSSDTPYVSQTDYSP